MHPIRSLEARLIFMIVGWTIVTVTAIAWLLGNHAEAVSRRALELRLATAADQMASAAEIGTDGILSLGRQPDEPGFARPRSGWYWIVVSGEESIAASRSLSGGAVSNWWHVARTTGTGPHGEDVTTTARTIRRGAGGEADLIATAPLAEIRAEALAVRATIFRLMIALAILLVLGVIVQVRLGLRPLRRLVTHIEAIRAGRETEVPSLGISHLDAVADAVNRLVSSLTRLAERSREEAANLAHAIKTPLSIILLRAGSPPHPDAGIAASAEQIQRQIDRRLRRSRTGDAVGLGLHATEIRPVVDDAVLAAAHIHAGRSIVPSIIVPQSLSAPLPREDLEEVLGNVVDNAFAWAKTEVRISAEPEAGGVVLCVDDDGPGIAPCDIDRVLARGGRLDEVLPGAGLGLAIVGDVVADHGGTLKLDRSRLGGLGVRIHLPADRGRSVTVAPSAVPYV